MFLVNIHKHSVIQKTGAAFLMLLLVLLGCVSLFHKHHHTDSSCSATVKVKGADAFATACLSHQAVISSDGCSICDYHFAKDSFLPEAMLVPSIPLVYFVPDSHLAPSIVPAFLHAPENRGPPAFATC